MVVRWVVVPQVRAESFDPPELNMADDGTSFLVMLVAVEESCHQIVGSSMQDFQVQFKVLHALSVACVPERDLQNSFASLLRSDSPHIDRTAIGDTSLADVSRQHLPAIPAFALQCEFRHSSFFE